MNNFIITILGKKGSGKTHLAKNIIALCPLPVFIIDSLHEYSQGVIYNNIKDLIYDYVNKLNKSNVYILRPVSDIDIDTMFKCVYKINNTLTLVCEEADMYCNPYKIDEYFSNIIKYGRHYNHNIIAISRRPAEINRLLTSQSDCIITFRQTEARDLQYLKQITQDADKAVNLDKYQYMIIGDVPDRLKACIYNDNCVHSPI